MRIARSCVIFVVLCLASFLSAVKSETNLNTWISRAFAAEKLSPEKQVINTSSNLELGQLKLGESWFSSIGTGSLAELKTRLCTKFVVSGLRLKNDSLRNACLALGEERSSMNYSLRISLETETGIDTVLSCVVEDMIRVCLPKDINPWSGKPDKKGRQATLKVVKSLPKELKQEAKGLSQVVSDPTLRIVEFRGTDNRGISAVAALLIGKEQEKDCVRGMLVSSKFEE